MVLRGKISTRPENVHVQLDGDYSLEDAKRNFLDVLKVVESTGLAKVLFDGRDVAGEPPALDRFVYGDFAAGAVTDLLKRGFDGGPPQFAYVLEEPMLDPGRLGETVARNRGMNAKAFSSIDEAVEWLELADEADSNA